MNLRILRNIDVTRLGYPIEPGGALYYVTSEEGLIQMAVDIECFRLIRKGVVLTVKHGVQFLTETKRESDIYFSKISDYGIPVKIQKLFEIPKKLECEKYCKNSFISEFELYVFIQNCHLIGYSHKSKFPEYVPQYLQIVDSDKEKLHKGDPSRVSKKLNSILVERKHIHVHLFERDLDWHCFYYNYDDIEENSNHWKFGEHVHYIDSKNPYWTKEQIWDTFDERKSNLSGDFHIKFKPFKYEQIKNHKKSDTISKSFAQCLYTFDQTRSIENIVTPIPSAQIATRGCYVSKVTI